MTYISFCIQVLRQSWLMLLITLAMARARCACVDPDGAFPSPPFYMYLPLLASYTYWCLLCLPFLVHVHKELLWYSVCVCVCCLQGARVSAGFTQLHVYLHVDFNIQPLVFDIKSFVTVTDTIPVVFSVTSQVLCRF